MSHLADTLAGHLADTHRAQQCRNCMSISLPWRGHGPSLALFSWMYCTKALGEDLMRFGAGCRLVNLPASICRVWLSAVPKQGKKSGHVQLIWLHLNACYGPQIPVMVCRSTMQNLSGALGSSCLAHHVHTKYPSSFCHWKAPSSSSQRKIARLCCVRWRVCSTLLLPGRIGSDSRCFTSTESASHPTSEKRPSSDVLRYFGVNKAFPLVWCQNWLVIWV